MIRNLPAPLGHHIDCNEMYSRFDTNLYRIGRKASPRRVADPLNRSHSHSSTHHGPRSLRPKDQWDFRQRYLCRRSSHSESVY